MSSLAKPRQESDIIEILDKESEKSLLSDRNEYIYSTIFGHRGIHPVFDMRHELVRFKFIIHGGDEAASNITLNDIYMESKYKALFTVASENELELGLNFNISTDYKKFHLQEIDVDDTYYTSTRSKKLYD